MTGLTGEGGHFWPASTEGQRGTFGMPLLPPDRNVKQQYNSSSTPKTILAKDVRTSNLIICEYFFSVFNIYVVVFGNGQQGGWRILTASSFGIRGRPINGQEQRTRQPPR